MAEPLLYPKPNRPEGYTQPEWEATLLILELDAMGMPAGQFRPLSDSLLSVPQRLEKEKKIAQKQKATHKKEAFQQATKRRIDENAQAAAIRRAERLARLMLENDPRAASVALRVNHDDPTVANGSPKCSRSS